MKKSNRKTQYTIPIILIIIIIVGAYLLLRNGGDAPINPLDSGIVQCSQMYSTENNSLTINGAAVKKIEKYSKNNHEDKQKKTDKRKKTDSDSTESKSKGDEYDDRGDIPADSLYFLTTIIDNETVSKLQYEFSIVHLQDSLSVKKVIVTVNGQRMENFAGKVFLKEGANTITVTVKYETPRGKKIVAEKTYTVNVDMTNLYISTDLVSEEVDNPYHDFEAIAKYKNNKAQLTVYLNGKEIEGCDEHYEVTLKKGHNRILLKAAYGSHHIEKEYIITFIPGQGYKIFTTLTSKIINSDSISFQAMIINGTSKAALTVICNGKVLKGSGGKYKANLNIGNNTIRLKAKDTGKVSIYKAFVIKYVPLSTLETEPRLNYINVENGMEVKGDTFTLNIGAEDYKGNKIYYDGINVKLNGERIQYKWSSKYVSYSLKLLTGSNIINIRLTDTDGRFKDYQYEIKCAHIGEGTPIGNVSVQVDAKVLHLGIIMKNDSVQLCYGDTVADIINKSFKEKDLLYDCSGTFRDGFYLVAIKKAGIARRWSIDQGLLAEIEEDGLMLNKDSETGRFVYDNDSLGQQDFCQGSGWMYEINGEYLTYGMSEYKPKDGDKIGIRFTLAYGKDIGAYSTVGGTYGIKDSYENVY